MANNRGTAKVRPDKKSGKAIGNHFPNSLILNKDLVFEIPSNIIILDNYPQTQNSPFWP